MMEGVDEKELGEKVLERAGALQFMIQRNCDAAKIGPAMFPY